MTLPTSLLSYAAEIDAMEKAMESDMGIRIRMRNWEHANFFRMRLHYARTLDRKQNKEIYQETSDHKMYGCSQYDPLFAKIRYIDGVCWLYLEKVDRLEFDTELLTERAPYMEIEPPKPLLQITVRREDGSEGRAELLEPFKRRV